MYEISCHPQQRWISAAGRDPADTALLWPAGWIQAETSELQRGEGVEGELGLVLIHEEALEVRQLVCGWNHRTTAHVSLLHRAAFILSCDFELTLQEGVWRWRVGCGKEKGMMKKLMNYVGHVLLHCRIPSAFFSLVAFFSTDPCRLQTGNAIKQQFSAQKLRNSSTFLWRLLYLFKNPFLCEQQKINSTFVTHILYIASKIKVIKGAGTQTFNFLLLGCFLFRQFF